MENPGTERAHFIHGRGRLGTTIGNGLENLSISVVSEPEQADVIWFCVPEKTLESAAEELAERMGPGIIAVHTSGLLPSELIRVRPDIKVGSLHPAYSFAKPLPDIPGNILWTFEGDAETRDLLSALISAWHGKWVEISAEAKIAYHIACVLMGNLVDIPIAAAEEICRAFGLPFSEIAHSLLLPHIAGCSGGQVLKKTTGPASRGDLETVERETEWLRRNFPEQAPVYKLLSALISKKNT